MAFSPVYYDNTVSASGDGTTPATALKTIAEALSNVSAGGKILVSKLSAETLSAANVVLTSPGTAQATAVQILCVDFSNGNVDAVGASVTVAGTYNLQLAYYARSRGVSFSAVGGIIFNSTLGGWDIEDTTLAVTGAAASAAVGSVASSGITNRLGLRNATVKLGATGQSIVIDGQTLSWRGGALAGSVPTSLLKCDQPTRAAFAMIEGVDLSLLTSTSKLATSTAIGTLLTFKDCIIPVFTGGAVAPTSLAPGSRVNLIRCANAAGAFVNESYAFEGIEVDASTVYRAGGTDDGVSGGTPRSRKLATSANAVLGTPFVSNDIEVWCDVAGSPVTVTVYGIIAGSTTPSNADIWLEAEFLKNSGNPLGGFALTGLATPQATSTTYSTGSMTWTGGANVGSPATTFEMSLTFTPAQKGPVTLRVKAAKASATFFYDSKPAITVGGNPLTISRSYVGPNGVTIHETGAVTQGATVNVLMPGPVRRSR